MINPNDFTQERPKFPHAAPKSDKCAGGCGRTIYKPAKDSTCWYCAPPNERSLGIISNLDVTPGTGGRR